MPDQADKPIEHEDKKVTWARASWQIPVASMLVSMGMGMFGNPQIGLIGGVIAATGVAIGFLLTVISLFWLRTPRVPRHAVAGLILSSLLGWMFIYTITAAIRAREHRQQHPNQQMPIAITRYRG